MTGRTSIRRGGAGILAAALAALLPAGAEAQQAPPMAVDPAKEAIRLEIQYAQALKELGLPDFAEVVINRIKDPAVLPIKEAMNIENLAALGKFDEAKALIKSKSNQQSPEVWAMWLALADSYYAWGKYNEAKAIYEMFFKTYSSGPPPALSDFYINSSYRYAQMLLMMGDDRGAVAAFQNLLKATPKGQENTRHIRRQIQGEMSDVLLRVAEKASAGEKGAYLDAVKAIAEELMWVQDIWFGKGLVMLAHVKMMKGDVEGALRDLNNPQYMQILQTIDKSLRDQDPNLVRLSPLAECRFLLGQIMYKKAKQLITAGADANRDQILMLLVGKKIDDKRRTQGAVQQYLLVFLEYPDTLWAAEAGMRANEIKEILKTKFGISIDFTVSKEQWEKVINSQFMEARALFNQQRFADAAEAYLKVLNLFPEGERSVGALGELATCYIELGEDLYADMTIRYLSERFGHNRDVLVRAGDEVLRLGALYREKKRPEKAEAMDQLFMTHFKKHGRAPLLILNLGEQKMKAEDYDGALTAFQQVAAEYKDSPKYLDAVSRIAECYNKKSAYTNEADVLENVFLKKLAENARPGHLFASGKFRLANAYLQLGGEDMMAKSSAIYDELINMLGNAKTRGAYQSSPLEEKNNDVILEGAIVQKALCLAKVTNAPPDKIKAYKQEAIVTLTNLVQRYPRSPFAPKALMQIGTLWTILENSVEAEKALDRLQKEYRDSPEAKNAPFLRARSLLEMGKRKQAVEEFKKMFSGQGGTFSPVQILTAGKELFGAGEYEIAAEAFTRVVDTAGKDRNLLEAALLWKGKALIQLGKYEEGAKAVDTMLQQFRGSGYTVEASFFLSRAYSELGAVQPDAAKRFEIFNNAVDAINKARQYVLSKAMRDRPETPGLLAKFTVESGRIVERKAKAEEKFGDKAKAAEYRGQAVGTYITLTETGDTRDPEIRRQMEEAYHECIPLILDLKRWSAAKEEASRYLELFPEGRYRMEVTQWRTQAEIKMVTEGGGGGTGASSTSAEKK